MKKERTNMTSKTKRLLSTLLAFALMLGLFTVMPLTASTVTIA